MKRTLILFACVAICCAMTVSCKNVKTAEPTPEEIQAQKVALADSVLAQIDAFVDEYINATENTFSIPYFAITDAEKMVKPDYLLAPSASETLLTKSQKINALAIYLAEISLRKIYDMPIEEAQEAAAKLVLELNHPVDMKSTSDVPRLERIKMEYEKCKENGELAYFWQFQNALVAEICYLISQNPELFFRNITDEQWQNFRDRVNSVVKAVAKLAKYDEDMAMIWNYVDNNRVYSSASERESIYSSVESAKRFYTANKDKFIARRNALIQ